MLTFWSRAALGSLSLRSDYLSFSLNASCSCQSNVSRITCVYSADVRKNFWEKEKYLKSFKTLKAWCGKLKKTIKPWQTGPFCVTRSNPTHQLTSTAADNVVLPAFAGARRPCSNRYRYLLAAGPTAAADLLPGGTDGTDGRMHGNCIDHVPRAGSATDVRHVSVTIARFTAGVGLQRHAVWASCTVVSPRCAAHLCWMCDRKAKQRSKWCKKNVTKILFRVTHKL